MASLNLATGLAERSGSNVVLIEADLRNPSLATRLGIKSWPGLVQCIDHGFDPVAALKLVSPLGFYLLPAGEPATNPIQMLNSDRFSRAIQRLRNLADWVIIDCPPVAPVPDVHAIRANADGCLWVVKSGSTSRDLVRETMQQVGQELVVGMILNEADKTKNSYMEYYHYGPVGMLGSGA